MSRNSSSDPRPLELDVPWEVIRKYEHNADFVLENLTWLTVDEWLALEELWLRLNSARRKLANASDVGLDAEYLKRYEAQVNAEIDERYTLLANEIERLRPIIANRPKKPPEMSRDERIEALAEQAHKDDEFHPNIYAEKFEPVLRQLLNEKHFEMADALPTISQIMNAESIGFGDALIRQNDIRKQRERARL